MPITPFLDGQAFDAETKRVMGVAFEMARAALAARDFGEHADGILAKRIIELAKGASAIPTFYASVYWLIFEDRAHRSRSSSPTQPLCFLLMAARSEFGPLGKSLIVFCDL